MVVFCCGETLEAILCAVYDAWASRLGHKNVRIELKDHENMELFCEYREVAECREKAETVIQAIRRRISEEGFKAVYEASLSRDEKRADWIYRFLLLGFYHGKAVMDMLQYEAVYRIFEMRRAVSREAHSYIEFLRFSQMENGILAGCIRPKNHVLPLIAPHFSDRLPSENWMIRDDGRKMAAIHPAEASWFLMDLTGKDLEKMMEMSAHEREVEGLWRTFFQSVFIEERKNPRCQGNLLPLRYRTYMTEFLENSCHKDKKADLQ